MARNYWLGKHLSEEHKAKISAAKSGKHLSNETRAKISIANSGENNAMYGKHRYFSEETRAKLSASHKGKIHSKETRTKMSKVQSGKNHPLYGKHHSAESKVKMSVAHSGERNYWFGKRLSEEHKSKLSIANDGTKFKRLNKDPKFISKRLKGLMMKPTKPETILISMIKKHNLPFKYVGDGQFILGGNCPDFINVNGKKQVIEMFGTYWHNLFDVARKKDHYRQYGFDTLVIWEDELKNEETTLRKIQGFAKKKVGAVP